MCHGLKRAKFCPLRIVTLTESKEPGYLLPYTDLVGQFHKALEDCSVFFLDYRHPKALAGLHYLKSVSKTVFCYLPCAQFGTGGFRGQLIETAARLLELKEQGWDGVEFSFWEGCPDFFMRACLDIAHRVGLQTCLFVHADLARKDGEWASWEVDAVSVSEVRSTRSVPDIRKAIAAGLPVYCLEYGTPNSPGKSRLDLKTFAIKHRVSVTMGSASLKERTSGPAFHYFVTY